MQAPVRSHAEQHRITRTAAVSTTQRPGSPSSNNLRVGRLRACCSDLERDWSLSSSFVAGPTTQVATSMHLSLALPSERKSTSRPHVERTSPRGPGPDARPTRSHTTQAVTCSSGRPGSRWPRRGCDSGGVSAAHTDAFGGLRGDVHAADGAFGGRTHVQHRGGKATWGGGKVNPGLLIVSGQSLVVPIVSGTCLQAVYVREATRLCGATILGDNPNVEELSCREEKAETETPGQLVVKESGLKVRSFKHPQR